MDKLSYALGLSMGHNFLGSGIKSLNVEDFAKGVEAVYKQEKPEISFDEAKKIINEFFPICKMKSPRRINRPEKNFWQRMPSVPVWWYFPAVCNMKCLPREKVVSRKLPIKFNVIIMEL